MNSTARNKIIETTAYLRKVKRLTRNNKPLRKEFIEVTKQLAKDPYYPKLDTHHIKSHPKYGDVLSSDLTSDLRIFWKWETNKIILLIIVGTHDDLYGGN